MSDIIGKAMREAAHVDEKDTEIKIYKKRVIGFTVIENPGSGYFVEPIDSYCFSDNGENSCDFLHQEQIIKGVIPATFEMFAVYCTLKRHGVDLRLGSEIQGEDHPDWEIKLKEVLKDFNKK